MYVCLDIPNSRFDELDEELPSTGFLLVNEVLNGPLKWFRSGLAGWRALPLM